MWRKEWCAIAIACACSWADNPIVQTYFTPDPAPMVHNDTLYVYTGHDEDVTEGGFFTMYDWRVYSTTDLVNWTDHGSPLSYKTFSWAGNKAWAAQCIYRNGKYYWYVTAGLKGSNQPAIGVAVSDNATGPFKDAIGKPLVTQSWDDIDPTVFIDDGGQAYLYWGNPQLYYVKLNEDMISYTGGVQKIAMTPESFGPRAGGDSRHLSTYEEGPWFFKRDKLYYMVYAAGPLPEPISYATSPGPTGPWTFRGKIMDGGNTNSFTNHSGVVEYKGKGYFFYHTGKILPEGGGYHRAAAVESFDFGADGSIPKLSATSTGPSPIATLNPYKRVEAETIAWAEWVKTQQDATAGVYVTQIGNGDFIKVRNVDFGTGGAKRFMASYASAGNTGSIEVRANGKTGTLLGTLAVSGTGGATTWKDDSVDVSGAVGVMDVYFVFKGGSGASLFNLNYWRFSKGIDIPEHRDTIANGSFAMDDIGWKLNLWSGTANGSVVGGEYKLDVQEAGTENYQIQLVQAGLILQKGKSYELSFDAYTTGSRSLEVNVEQDVDPWTSYLDKKGNFSLGSGKNSFKVVFTMSQPTDSSSRVSFNAGGAVGPIFLDNVVLKETDIPVMILRETSNRPFLRKMNRYDLLGRCTNLQR